MAEKDKETKINLKIVQKTTILDKNKEGKTTYKINFFIDDIPITKNGMETYAIEVINSKGVLIRYELYGDIPNGKVVENYETGTVMLEKNYFNGQKNGPYKLYYPSGELWKEGRFVSDQIIRLKTFAPNGKLLSDKIFAEIISVKTGNIEVFYKNGKEVARWITNPDGTVKKSGETIDGIVQYFVGKTLKEEHIYDDGFLVTIKKYDKNGRVLTERTYARGQVLSKEGAE